MLAKCSMVEGAFFMVNVYAHCLAPHFSISLYILYPGVFSVIFIYPALIVFIGKNSGISS